MVLVRAMLTPVRSSWWHRGHDRPSDYAQGDSKVTIQKGEVYEDAGAEAVDDTDGDLSNAIEVEGEDLTLMFPVSTRLPTTLLMLPGTKLVSSGGS